MSAGQLPPLPDPATVTVMVESVKVLSGGLLAFTCRLSDNSIHTLVMSGKGSNLGTVTIAADVVATLALSGKGPG